MITDPELSRTVRAFFEEGVDRMPDRVFQAVMDGATRAPQQRSLGPLRRLLPMPSSFKLAGAIGAIALLVAVGAYAVLPIGGGIGGAPTPTPSPSPSPTAAPVTIGGPMALPAGTYAVGEPFPRPPFSIVVPDGWRANAVTGGEASFSSDAGGPAGAFVGLFVVRQVVDDPCGHGPFDTTPAEPPVQDLVEGFSSMEGFEPTPVSDTTVGGLPAYRFGISNDIDTATAGCTDDLLLPLFVDASGAPASTNGGLEQQLWVVDHPAGPILVVAETGKDPVAGQAAVDELIAGIRFNP